VLLIEVDIKWQKASIVLKGQETPY
jgi:hypothetical protein